RLFDRSAGRDIAITGDSRILHGIDADVVEQVVEQVGGQRLSVLNAGLSAASPMNQLAWVRRFVTQPKKPRVVVLQIAPYMFSSATDQRMAREGLHTMYRVRDVPALIRAGVP